MESAKNNAAKNTSAITEGFIKSHPSIKDCLIKGIINYSSLSRLIADELELKKNASKDAILIAARRFRDKIRKQQPNENDILRLLKSGEIEAKNKIFRMVVEKGHLTEDFLGLEKEIRKEKGAFYAIEGTKTITIISSMRYLDRIKENFSRNILDTKKNLVMIIINTSETIEETTGVISYVYSLFAENGINIIDTMSCWTDTILVIEEKDLSKAMELLKF